jgi:polyketide cyclase/dehydrase/lipid transport protein
LPELQGAGLSSTFPTRRIEHSVFLDATPEAAYDYMTTLKHWCHWYPGTLAMEGQTDAPSAAGNTATETVRTLGMLGKLHWTTVESVRPWRFVIETTSVEMPLMRRARLRVIYAFEPANEPLELRTRLARTLEYEFTGLARFLDRVYLHGHFKQKTVLALIKLQGIVARGVADGSLSHVG